MSLLNGSDLLEAGWEPGPNFGLALAKAREYEARGVTERSYLLKLLRRDFPPQQPKIQMRQESAPLAEAIAATCEEDVKNIKNVRRYMQELLLTPVVARGAVMPDACPAGSAPATIPVGGAIAVQNAIIPSAHSADICCSMHASFFKCDKDVSSMLDDLMASTRFGMGGRKPENFVPHAVNHEPVWENPFLQGLEGDALKHMADQGDGNHFAYLGRMSLSEEGRQQLHAAGHQALADSLAGEQECLVLVTHHGSRGLGAKVYARGQKAALAHVKKHAENVPVAAAWLDYGTQEGQDYWEALQYVSRWTKANHESIHARFLEKVGASFLAAFGNEHNFVWKRGNTFLHGKGATPAWKDEDGRPLLGLIPLNMASSILMVLGKDNQDYLSFCPHGAGRNVSRSAMLRDYKNDEGELDEKRVAQALAESTKDIQVRWFYGKADLSESPLGYKPAAQVKAQIQQFGLADVVAEIKPLGSIMAGDSGPPPWIRRKEELTPKQLRAIEHRSDRRKERQRLRDVDDVEAHSSDGDM
ncbi:MAG TPA: RtcB family protein [Verrucomicrobium sp.]|nr:RtcB family protein [Verrucomicrobium sp.]